MNILESNIGLRIIATGAGAGIQNFLWRIPGASIFLLDANFPYDPEFTQEHLGYKPGKFVSEEVAVNLAAAAYLKAAKVHPNPVGLGITATAASTRIRKSGHKAFLCVFTKKTVLLKTVELEPKTGEEARLIDGNTIDFAGLELLNKAIREETDDPSVYSRVIDHLLVRPRFTVDGQRLFIPENGKLLPGSFDPPHDGHFWLGGTDVTFQLTIDHPAKGLLHPSKILTRIANVTKRRNILIMKERLFVEKAERFKASRFYVGGDVLLTIFDPKWGVSVEDLVNRFLAARTEFFYCIRDQAEADKIQTLLTSLPEETRKIFIKGPDSPYADLSSTKIRAQQTA